MSCSANDMEHCARDKMKVNKINERDKGNTQIIVADDAHILEYWVQKDMNNELELGEDDEFRIVCTQKNLVSNYLCDLLQRGTVYGLNVSIQDNRVTRFRISEQFIENENYYDVKCTIDTLNEHVTNNKHKYTYMNRGMYMYIYIYICDINIYINMYI